MKKHSKMDLSALMWVGCLAASILVLWPAARVHGFQHVTLQTKGHFVEQQENYARRNDVAASFSQRNHRINKNKYSVSIGIHHNQVQLSAFHRKRPVRSGVLSASIPPEVWTSFLPPILGFIQSEYTISYAYGFSAALTGLTVLLKAMDTINVVPDNFFDVLFNSPNGYDGFVLLHAMALIFYGTRLNLFLAIRNQLSPRIRKFNEDIENRALEKGNRFTTRAPFIISCGLLYYGLSAPLLFTSKMLGSEIDIPTWTSELLYVLVGIEWFGFALAAVGDVTKSWVKLKQKDDFFLVTNGIFSVLRHPNYTGEIIGWSANLMCGILAAVPFFFQGENTLFDMKDDVANLVFMMLGWIGITFVLLRATSNLEAKQQYTYGSDPTYQRWVESTWSGWCLELKQSDK